MQDKGSYISILSPQLLEFNILFHIKKELPEDIDNKCLDKITEIIHNIVSMSVEEKQWEAVTKE